MVSTGMSSAFNPLFRAYPDSRRSLAPGRPTASFSSLDPTFWAKITEFGSYKIRPSTGIQWLKWHIPITFSSPRANRKWYFFGWQKKSSYIFLVIIPKYQLRVHYTLAVIAENTLISGRPIFIFLCIFQQLHPQCHILVFAPGEKTRAN